MTGQILTAYVASQPDLVSRVGDRVRPVGADTDDALPYLTYLDVDGQRPGGLDGPSGLADGRLQVNVVAATYGEAKLLARLLAGTRDETTDLPTGLDGFKGTLGGIDVRRVKLEDVRDTSENPVSGQQRPLYEIQLDFMVAFDEAALAASAAEG